MSLNDEWSVLNREDWFYRTLREQKHRDSAGLCENQAENPGDNPGRKSLSMEKVLDKIYMDQYWRDYELRERIEIAWLNPPKPEGLNDEEWSEWDDMVKRRLMWWRTRDNPLEWNPQPPSTT